MRLFLRCLIGSSLALTSSSLLSAQVRVVATQEIPDLVPGTFDAFGGALASLGDLDGDGLRELLVGTPRDDRGGQDAGVVWMLFLDTDGSVRSSVEIGEGAGGFGALLDPGDNLGGAVAAIGDLNGDGREDFVVGAPGDDDGATDQGALWVCFPDASGTLVASTKISRTTGGLTGLCCGQARFGKALARVGDLDADGLDELAVSTDSEQVFLLFLHADGTVRGQSLLPRPAGSTAQDGLGGSLAGPCDVNQDGTPDLLVGVNRSYRRSALYTYFLSSAGTVLGTARVDWAAGGFQGVTPELAPLARSLAALGDLDGDGQIEVAMGSALDATGCVFGLSCYARPGGAWLVGLLPDGSVGQEHKLLEGSIGSGTFPALDGFASAVAGLGDLDGNGWADLAIGAAYRNGTNSNQGSVWIAFLDGASARHAQAPRNPPSIGPRTPGAPPPATRKLGNHHGRLAPPLQAYALLGTAVARLGDLDDDGIEDLVVGTPGVDAGSAFEAGAVRILFLDELGTVRESREITAAQLLGPGHFGWSVAALGDHDGDGVEDIAVGCPQLNRAWIVFLEQDGSVKGSVRITDALPTPVLGTLFETYGVGLAALGDLDGDGVSELALLDSGGTSGDENDALFVLFLNADGTVASWVEHPFSLGGNQARTISCASLGDLDGDGRNELAFGEGLNNRVVVLFFDPDGSIRRQRVITGPAGTRYGTATAGIGDVNGDGVEDLAVGAPGTSTFRGSTWLIHLDALGNPLASFQIVGPGGLASALEPADRFGSALALLEDGSGRTTLVVGASGDDDGGTESGALWLLDLP